jgi:hypothetical protein
MPATAAQRSAVKSAKAVKSANGLSPQPIFDLMSKLQSAYREADARRQFVERATPRLDQIGTVRRAGRY